MNVKRHVYIYIVLYVELLGSFALTLTSVALKHGGAN